MRHHVDYQSCHGVRCAHGVRSSTDVCSRVFLVRLCYGQGLTLDSRSSTGKLIKEFGPRYHRRGISDDPALRELGIFSALGVYWPSSKGDKRTSCTRESFSVIILNLCVKQYSVADKYMLFAGWGVRIVKNCDRGLENAALGLRPRAAFSRPRSQFFTIRTDPKPVNNLFIFFFLG